jgi:hypothetical protein
MGGYKMNTLKKVKGSIDILFSLFMLGQVLFIYSIHLHYSDVRIPTHFTFSGEADAFGNVMDLYLYYFLSCVVLLYIFMVGIPWNSRKVEVRGAGNLSEKRELFYTKVMIFTRIIGIYIASLEFIALLTLRHMLHRYQTIAFTPGWTVGLGVLGLTIIVIIGLILVNKNTEPYEKQHLV